MGEPHDSGWTRCQYFMFWDVPRALVVHRQGRTLLLDSDFDEVLDDYSPNYSVWELEPAEPEVALELTWDEVKRRKQRQLEDLPVSALEFRRERERRDKHSYAWYRFK